MIAEFLQKARSMMNKSDIRHEKTEIDYYQPTITRENCRYYRHKYYDDPDYKFIYDAFDYIQGTIQLFESIVYEILYDKTRSGKKYIIIFYVVGMFFFSFLIYYTRTIIKEIYTSMKELINIIFIIPQSAVDASSAFKSLIINRNVED